MRGWRGALAAAVLAGTVFTAVQLGSPHAVGVDGLFHIKAADLLRNNLPRPWMPEFRWLERTSLRHDRFADFHWGFHLLLVPFTLLDLEAAAKVAPIVLSTASFLALFFVLCRIGSRRPMVWTVLALASSPIFLMRLSQNKAPTATLGLLILIAWAALAGRDVALGLLCLAAGWLYPVLPLLLAVPGAGLLCRVLIERRLPLRSTAVVIGATVASQLVHPDFPRNISFLWENLSEASAYRAGEFAPLRPADAASNLGLLGAVFLLALYWTLRGRVRDREAAWTFCLLGALMAALTARYVRAIDYLPPFVALFAAAALDEPVEALLSAAKQRLRYPASRTAAAVLIAALLIAAVWVQVQRGRQVVSHNSASVPHRLEAAARWLSERTSPGEMVVNLSSGDFEELWLYDTSNTYLVGLNLFFLRTESPLLFDRYARVYQLADMESLRDLMQEAGPARYVVASDRLPPPLLRAVASSALFETAYKDRSCLIARLR